MLKIIMLFAVLALMGNAIATPEQRSEARAMVKRLEWIPISILSVIGLFILVSLVR